jgi:hypothetical protein
VKTRVADHSWWYCVLVGGMRLNEILRHGARIFPAYRRVSDVRSCRRAIEMHITGSGGKMEGRRLMLGDRVCWVQDGREQS